MKKIHPLLILAILVLPFIASSSEFIGNYPAATSWTGTETIPTIQNGAQQNIGVGTVTSIALGSYTPGAAGNSFVVG